MRLDDLLQHLDPIRVAGPTRRRVREVRLDSRRVGPDDVFVALRGARVDGRRFAPDLRDAAAVIAEPPFTVAPGVTRVEVRDARLALARAAAARHGHPGRAVPVVGITGTNGKTTTAWMLEAIARAAGLVPAVIGTTGHRVAGAPVAEPPGAAHHTTPEAPLLQELLARARDAGCGLVAMEVSSIGLALRRADAIPFRVAVFTSFSRDHLDFHGDMDAYLAAKRRLFAELLAPGGTAVLHGDDPAWERLRPEGARTWTFGRDPRHDLAVLDARADTGGTRARVRTPAGEVELRLRLAGEHNLVDALAALGAALALGVAPEAAARGLAALDTVPGRLEPVPGGPGAPAVFVDFAHTPDALERVLASLRPLTRGRLWVVFGAGGDRDPGKRPLMGAVAARLADEVVVTSDNPRSEDPAAIVAAVLAGARGGAARVRDEVDRARAIALAIDAAGPDDVVLVAGKGHETTQEIAGRVLPFDDRAVARAALARRSER